MRPLEPNIPIVAEVLQPRSKPLSRLAAEFVKSLTLLSAVTGRLRTRRGRPVAQHPRNRQCSDPRVRSSGCLPDEDHNGIAFRFGTRVARNVTRVRRRLDADPHNTKAKMPKRAARRGFDPMSPMPWRGISASCPNVDAVGAPGAEAFANFRRTSLRWSPDRDRNAESGRLSELGIPVRFSMSFRTPLNPPVTPNNNNARVKICNAFVPAA